MAHAPKTDTEARAFVDALMSATPAAVAPVRRPRRPQSLREALRRAVIMAAWRTLALVLAVAIGSRMIDSALVACR